LERGLVVQAFAGDQHSLGLFDQDPTGQRVTELANLGLAADHHSTKPHRDTGHRPHADLADHRCQPDPARICFQVGHRHRLPLGGGSHTGSFPEILLDLFQQLRHGVGGHQRTRLAVLAGQHQSDPVGGQHRPGCVDQLLQQGRQIARRRRSVGQSAQRTSHRRPVELILHGFRLPAIKRQETAPCLDSWIRGSGAVHPEGAPDDLAAIWVGLHSPGADELLDEPQAAPTLGLRVGDGDEVQQPRVVVPDGDVQPVAA
jgi:hypothetical protein